MRGDDHPTTARMSAFVGSVLVALATTVSASLLALGPDAPLAAGIAMLAVAIGALVHTTQGGITAPSFAPRPGARQPVPALASRVTDTDRHPVRPRAPGTV
ncbi:hypothetical protein ACFQ0K_09140 [Nocardioides caeni]|uniref:Uncharacterized protein n=1 Tax=Nocardioides caeni TaxID=574700 RepID=A0A4S8N093_9ACTN|nr:hypothetical protein [Nocardioides caeni]THV09177.1 hypothetical protein E9934_17255 [Nocardioides caeni]